MRRESTPDLRSCDELAAFFPDVPHSRMVKTLLYRAISAEETTLWAVLIRGDQEVNEVKLRNHVGGLALELLTDEEIEAATGAARGFAGPVGLPETFRVVADETVRGMRNLLCGVNQTDFHALDVNLGRDFDEPEYADLRLAREGEPGPRNGDPLVLRRGIEVGHIFKLGDKYSEAMGATFMNENGRPAPFVMGCYGIGISRVAQAAAEQLADEKGLVWPVPIAPFEVVVACLKPKDESLLEAAEAFHGRLQEAGLESMFDDRRISPGAKLKDLELLGFPYAVVVGRGYANDGLLEVRDRRAGTTENLDPDATVAWLTERIEAARGGLAD